MSREKLKPNIDTEIQIQRFGAWKWIWFGDGDIYEITYLIVITEQCLETWIVTFNHTHTHTWMTMIRVCMYHFILFCSENMHISYDLYSSSASCFSLWTSLTYNTALFIVSVSVFSCYFWNLNQKELTTAWRKKLQYNYKSTTLKAVLFCGCHS